MFKFFVASALSILLIGCGNSDNSSTNSSPKPKKPKTEIQTMKAKFSSMNKCLDSIEKASKGPLRIVTDKPDEYQDFYLIVNLDLLVRLQKQVQKEYM
jgi:hypothetical protein